MPWNRPLILALLLVLLAAAWWQWRPAEEPLHRTRLLMGTTVEIIAMGPSADRNDEAVEAAFAEMTRLEHLLGRAYPDSDPAKINGSETPVSVAAETAAVLALGLRVTTASDGAFDLGLGRLKDLWGIEGDTPRVPSPEAVAEALVGTGPGAVTLTDRTVQRRSKVLVDLAGVAKGFIVDRAIDVLKQHGVSAAAVNAGGDMYLLGRRPDRPWRIGIQHPRHASEVIATLELADRAVVTSGDYERYFEKDGRRYHHLFDPQTGYPADRCQSVTVIADEVAQADALATALFVLGPERGLALLREFPGSEALVIDAGGRKHASTGFAAYRAAP